MKHNIFIHKPAHMIAVGDIIALDLSEGRALTEQVIDVINHCSPRNQNIISQVELKHQDGKTFADWGKFFPVAIDPDHSLKGLSREAWRPDVRVEATLTFPKYNFNGEAQPWSSCVVHKDGFDFDGEAFAISEKSEGVFLIKGKKSGVPGIAFSASTKYHPESMGVVHFYHAFSGNTVPEISAIAPVSPAIACCQVLAQIEKTNQIS
jgi:hypothetical protein